MVRALHKLKQNKTLQLAALSFKTQMGWLTLKSLPASTREWFLDDSCSIVPTFSPNVNIPLLYLLEPENQVPKEEKLWPT